MPGSTRAEPPGAGAGGPLPHDLLALAAASALVCDGPAPAWVGASLARAPFVVVRRCAGRGGLVPVGVRGTWRGQRFAAWLAPEDAAARVRPEELAARRGWLGDGRPQLAALSAVERLMAAHDLRWGPIGSVGFELATGAPAVASSSDLDVLVRAPAPPDRDAARRLLAALSALPVRVDVQLEVPAGGVALAEWLGAGPRVALRTPEGPRLVADPWGGSAAGP